MDTGLTDWVADPLVAGACSICVQQMLEPTGAAGTAGAIGATIVLVTKALLPFILRTWREHVKESAKKDPPDPES